MSRREYSHTVFNKVPDTAREEAYADAERMGDELKHQDLIGDVSIEVVRKNPRTYDIYIIFEDD